MNKNNKQSLSEAIRQDYMTEDEKKLKRRLVKLLLDDGKGHHHAAYAKRLKKFDVNIVPIGQEPSTAAISFDEGIIYINCGFLRDPSTFGQLNVIMRHELCHNLLMHQFRMINKLKDVVPELNLRTSSSIHELLNTLEDFEISNKKYSNDDKQTIRNMWINGKLISGLVTEDHRTAWAQMSLEKMYDAILAEIEKYKNTGEVNHESRAANLNVAVAELHSYKNSGFGAHFKNFDDFTKAIMKPALRYDRNAKMPENYANIINSIKTAVFEAPKNTFDINDVKQMITGIKDSKAIGPHEVVLPNNTKLVTVYTPEEKKVAIECLNIVLDKLIAEKEFDIGYKEIMRLAKKYNFSEDQIKDILAEA